METVQVVLDQCQTFAKHCQHTEGKNITFHGLDHPQAHLEDLSLTTKGCWLYWEDGPVSEMTYTVSSGTLNPNIPYHTIGRMVAAPLVSRMMPVPKTFVHD